MEHYPNLKKGESIELEGYKFTLDSIEQGFMRWFIVEPIKDKDQKDDQSKDENQKLFRGSVENDAFFV